MLLREEVELYRRDGYLPGRRLLSAAEAERRELTAGPVTRGRRGSSEPSSWPQQAICQQSIVH